MQECPAILLYASDAAFCHEFVDGAFWAFADEGFVKAFVLYFVTDDGADDAVFVTTVYQAHGDAGFFFWETGLQASVLFDDVFWVDGLFHAAPSVSGWYSIARSD